MANQWIIFLVTCYLIFMVEASRDTRTGKNGDLDHKDLAAQGKKLRLNE